MQDSVVLAFDAFASAENAVNERPVQTPELYLLALAQFATAADTEVVSMPMTLEVYTQPLAVHALNIALRTNIIHATTNQNTGPTLTNLPFHPSEPGLVVYSRTEYE